MEYLLLSINKKVVAISFDAIREIINLPHLQDVPYYGKGYLGMLNYRGATLPVYDAACLFFNEQLEVKPTTKLIILGNEEPVGLAFDDILMNVKGKEVKEREGGFFSSMLFVDNRIYPLARLEKILELIESEREIKPSRFCKVTPEIKKELQSRNLNLGLKEDKASYVEGYYLIFELEAELFAVKADIVNEILKVEKITAVPTAPEYIRGIISLRGNITTVFDLKTYYFHETTQLTSGARIIVFTLEEQKAGFLVDRVVDFVGLQKADKRLPHFISSPLSTLVTEQFEFDCSLVSILDLTKFFEEVYLKDGGAR
jgi:purine-binding chemotaxis protein CheW